VYERSEDGARHSPFDIEISLYDVTERDVTADHRAALQEAYATIYGWKYLEWKAALADVAQGGDLLNAKKDAFWETLAQHLAERVFGLGTSELAFKFGPECAKPAAGCRADQAVIAGVERVQVKTRVDGRRDPLNPATRAIAFDVRKGRLEFPQVGLELVIPAGLKVASTYQEDLDFRPTVAGSRTAVGEYKVLAATTDVRRTVGFDYPDYNLLFVPLRHLVFQGEVADPKGPEASLQYASLPALGDAFAGRCAALFEPATAAGVAGELEPFVTDKYYYMFGDGVAGYNDYILGAGAGIAKGLKDRFAKVQLWADGELVREAVPAPAP
jgi:hypothetical protein